MANKWIDPLHDPSKNNLKYDDKTIEFKNLKNILHGNKIFAKEEIEWYDKVNRFGFIDPYNTDQVAREYLFFTKPDLHIYGNNDDKTNVYVSKNSFTNNTGLNAELENVPFFVEADVRHRNSLQQLQYSVKDKNGVSNPFMYLLSNAVTSKLDLPGISAESRESTSNIMGTSIQYRGHSYKSDNGYDFSLSFTDTAYLELYTLVKAYDEYMRLLKTGEVTPFKHHIEYRVIPEQFSIYKFLVGSDGETILFYSKLTGCYFTDVPRSDFSDPGQDGFKYSISFHAQFVEDNNPMIISEFNKISPAKSSDYLLTYDYENKVVNNSWARWPKIEIVTYNSNTGNDKRVKRRGVKKDYRLRWVNG